MDVTAAVASSAVDMTLAIVASAVDATSAMDLFSTDATLATAPSAADLTLATVSSAMEGRHPGGTDAAPWRPLPAVGPLSVPSGTPADGLRVPLPPRASARRGPPRRPPPADPPARPNDDAARRGIPSFVGLRCPGRAGGASRAARARRARRSPCVASPCLVLGPWAWVLGVRCSLPVGVDI